MMKKKYVKLYQKQSPDKGTVFWTSESKGFAGEKTLKTRNFEADKSGFVRSGFYGKEYVSPTDAEFIRKELKSRKMKRL